MVRRAQSLDPGREFHDGSVMFHGDNLAAHLHSGFELLQGQERLIEHGRLTTHGGDAVHRPRADHSRAHLLANLEPLLELVQVLVRGVGYVAVAKGGVKVLVLRLELEQDADGGVHPSNHGGFEDGPGLGHRARSRRRLERHQVRTQGETNPLGSRVHVQHPRPHALTRLVRRRGIGRRAVHTAAHVECVHRRGEIRHEVHLKTIGEHRLHPRVDQHAREQRAHRGAVTLMRHRLRHPLWVRGALHHTAGALASGSLAILTFVTRNHHIQDGTPHEGVHQRLWARLARQKASWRVRAAKGQHVSVVLHAVHARGDGHAVCQRMSGYIAAHLREASGQVDSLTAALALAELANLAAQNLPNLEHRGQIKSLVLVLVLLFGLGLGLGRLRGIIPVGSLLAPLGRWREHVGGLRASHGSLQAIRQRDGESSIVNLRHHAKHLHAHTQVLILEQLNVLAIAHFLGASDPRGSLSRDGEWSTGRSGSVEKKKRWVGGGGASQSAKMSGRREDFRWCRSNSKDPHVRGDALGGLKGYAPRHLHHRTASSSASSRSRRRLRRYCHHEAGHRRPSRCRREGRPPRRRPRLWFAWHPSHVTSARVRCLNALQPGHDCGCSGRRRLEICLPPPTGARQRQVRVLFWGYGSLLGRIGGPFPPEGDQW